MHCWVWSDVHFKLLDQSVSMATPYRWCVSLLSGPHDPVGKTRRTSSLSKREWSRWCLCFNVFSNAHKSDDSHFLCGDICWPGFGKHNWELYIGGSSGLGCFRWLSLVVAHLDRGRWRILEKVQPSRIAVGQQDLRRDHHRVWFVCSRERDMIEA